MQGGKQFFLEEFYIHWKYPHIHLGYSISTFRVNELEGKMKLGNEQEAIVDFMYT